MPKRKLPADAGVLGDVSRSSARITRSKAMLTATTDVVEASAAAATVASSSRTLSSDEGILNGTRRKSVKAPRRMVLTASKGGRNKIAKGGSSNSSISRINQKLPVELLVVLLQFIPICENKFPQRRKPPKNGAPIELPRIGDFWQLRFVCRQWLEIVNRSTHFLLNYFQLYSSQSARVSCIQFGTKQEAEGRELVLARQEDERLNQFQGLSKLENSSFLSCIDRVRLNVESKGEKTYFAADILTKIDSLISQPCKLFLDLRVIELIAAEFAGPSFTDSTQLRLAFPNMELDNLAFSMAYAPKLNKHPEVLAGNFIQFAPEPICQSLRFLLDYGQHSLKELRTNVFLLDGVCRILPVDWTCESLAHLCIENQPFFNDKKLITFVPEKEKMFGIQRALVARFPNLSKLTLKGELYVTDFGAFSGLPLLREVRLWLIGERPRNHESIFTPLPKVTRLRLDLDYGANGNGLGLDRILPLFPNAVCVELKIEGFGLPHNLILMNERLGEIVRFLRTDKHPFEWLESLKLWLPKKRTPVLPGYAMVQEMFTLLDERCKTLRSLELIDEDGFRRRNLPSVDQLALLQTLPKSLRTVKLDACLLPISMNIDADIEGLRDSSEYFAALYKAWLKGKLLPTVEKTLPLLAKFHCIVCADQFAAVKVLASQLRGLQSDVTPAALFDLPSVLGYRITESRFQNDRRQKAKDRIRFEFVLSNPTYGAKHRKAIIVDFKYCA